MEPKKLREITQQMQPSYSFGVPLLALQKRLVNIEGLEGLEGVLVAQQAINKAEKEGVVRRSAQDRFYATEDLTTLEQMRHENRDDRRT